MIEVRNPYLDHDNDYWYHLGLAPTEETKAMFHDVKFVCMGGKGTRMKLFAEYLYNHLGKPSNSIFETGQQNGTKKLKNLTESAGRYSLYKVGNCISASHGIGMPSFSILLHEIIKLLAWAKCEDAKLIRLGTCGGLGLDPGTTVVTQQPYSATLEPFYTQTACGKHHKFESSCDEKLAAQILECGKKLKTKIVIGNTMSCDGFYEEQARLDGAVCNFSPDEKKEFLQRAHYEHGIVNIEMEANMFSAICNRAGVKCATVCVTMLNRLEKDIVSVEEKIYKNWEFQPLSVVAEFIRHSLKHSTD